MVRRLRPSMTSMTRRRFMWFCPIKCVRSGGPIRPLGPGKATVTKQKMKIRGDGSSGPAVPESSVDEVRDRLAGLLPDDALQDALEGLGPEEITGPGGLMSQLAGRVL